MSTNGKALLPHYVFLWILFKVGKRRLFVLVVGMGYAAVTCSMFTGVGRGEEGGGSDELENHFFRK